MSNTDDLYEVAGEPLAILRQRYLTTCDHNYCAAMLLDIFCAKVANAAEYEFYYKRNPPLTNYDPACVYTDLTGLTDRLFGLFDLTTVHNALQLLITKGYVKAWYDGEIQVGQAEEERSLKILCDREA